MIIDKGGVADGTSKTGSGMLGLFRPSHERAVVKYCLEFYRMLQDKGYNIGLEQNGGLNLATTKDRLISLTRRANRKWILFFSWKELIFKINILGSYMYF